MEKTSQSIELAFPELAVLLDPACRIPHGLCAQAAAVDPAILLPGQEARRLQHMDVFENGGQGDVERFR
jgi:hypothetical protein